MIRFSLMTEHSWESLYSFHLFVRVSLQYSACEVCIGRAK
jgi:hypothetical protein